MRIIKYINPHFPNHDWFRCTIDSETYSSPSRDNVELWRDDKLINADYYKELKEISDKEIQKNKKEIMQIATIAGNNDQSIAVPAFGAGMGLLGLVVTGSLFALGFATQILAIVADNI